MSKFCSSVSLAKGNCTYLLFPLASKICMHKIEFNRIFLNRVKFKEGINLQSCPNNRFRPCRIGET